MPPKNKPPESEWRKRYRIRQRRDLAVRHAEEGAERERARSLRYEEEDRIRTRWRRWRRAAAVSVSAVGGFALTAYGLYLTYDLFQVEFEQNRAVFEEERADRNAARMVRAWQVLTLAAGASRNVGQITALQTLHLGGENLRNLALGCPMDMVLPGIGAGFCVFLAGVDLRPAETEDGERPADLSGSNFRGANLTGANLTGANFENAQNIPDLSSACADPNNPPTDLPEGVKRPEPWEP